MRARYGDTEIAGQAELPPQTFPHHFEVQLTHSGNQCLSGLRMS
jgi:hypothetical protein